MQVIKKFFLVQNSLIQDLENYQKQLEEFHHTRVSKL